MEWTGRVTYVGKTWTAYTILVGKREQKVPFGIPSLRWKCTIKIYLKDVVCEIWYWIHLAQDRFNGASFCECGNENFGSIEGWGFLD
jgi:hypothetical protein